MFSWAAEPKGRFGANCSIKIFSLWPLQLESIHSYFAKRAEEEKGKRTRCKLASEAKKTKRTTGIVEVWMDFWEWTDNLVPFGVVFLLECVNMCLCDVFLLIEFVVNYFLLFPVISPVFSILRLSSVYSLPSPPGCMINGRQTQNQLCLSNR